MYILAKISQKGNKEYFVTSLDRLFGSSSKSNSITYVAGIKDGVVVEAPITHEYRQVIFTSLIDLQSRIDLIYGAGDEAASSYKKLLKEYYLFHGVPSNSIIRRYSNEYNKE